MDYITKILIENTTNLSERREVYALTESERFAVNNAMVNNLYQSAMDKSHIDFGDIPNTKGDITKYSGYKYMISVIELIKDMSTKSNTKIPELETLSDAINNIVAYRDLYEKGFKLEKKFIILHYTTMVYACIESTSALISSFIDYIKRPDKIEFVMIRNAKIGNSFCLDHLKTFNEEIKQGNYAKTLNTILATGKAGLLGIDDMVLGTFIIGTVLLLVPIIRELVFFFYYTRSKISDFMKQQALLMEIHRANTEINSSISNTVKEELIKKQTKRIETLKSISDKLAVDYAIAKNKSETELKKQNSSWSLKDMPKQTVQNNSNQFTIL